MSNQDNANSAQQPELVIYPDEYEYVLYNDTVRRYTVIPRTVLVLSTVPGVANVTASVCQDC